jgi:hypothetical protein
MNGLDAPKFQGSRGLLAIVRELKPSRLLRVGCANPIIPRDHAKRPRNLTERVAMPLSGDQEGACLSFTRLTTRFGRRRPELRSTPSAP